MNFFRRFLCVALLGLLAIVLFNGCATILHGSEEGVYFTSEPAKAKVYVRTAN